MNQVLRALSFTLFCSAFAPNNGSWNGPRTGVKGSLHEGGIRVPMIWSWPDKLPAASRHAGPVSSLDLLPSCMAVAGAKPLPLAAPLSHEDKRNRKGGELWRL